MYDKFAYVGVRIVTRLRELNLKQADLCRETGISSNAISQYVTGKRIPDTTSLYKMSTILGVTMEWILTGNTTNEKYLCDGVPLTESEADLVAMYRILDSRDKEDVFDFVNLKYQKATGEKRSVYSTYSDTKKPPKNDPVDDVEIADEIG